jgi:hypothetical protein
VIALRRDGTMAPEKGWTLGDFKKWKVLSDDEPHASNSARESKQ